VLLALTDERLCGQQDLRPALASTDHVQRGETAIAVLGRLTRADLDALATVRHGRLQGIALLLDADSFGSATPPDAAAERLFSLAALAGRAAMACRHGSQRDAGS